MNKSVKSRIGIYAWAGPGTIRLLKTKYHNPKIDEKSFLTAYDFSILSKFKKTFGVTDAWVTYSWGFSDATENEDRKFITSKLENFKKLGIKTHAYIQGFNLVDSDFKNSDPWARDFKNRMLAYSKGRSLTCPNNPEAVRIILERVQKACKEDFDGVFIDNIFMGLPPLFVFSDYLSFCGCSCDFCREKFEKTYKYKFPLREKRGRQVLDYLDFRAESTFEILKKAQEICVKNKKEFGVNLYDPVSYTPEVYFGYNLKKISPLLSYYLIENLSLPSQIKHNNSYYISLINSKKPTFIVSYNKGIGLDQEYSQKDMDLIFSEAEKLGYFPCLKVSEYKTKGVWHYLDVNDYGKPEINAWNFKKLKISTRKLRKAFFYEKFIGQITTEWYAPISTFLWDSRVVYAVLNKTRILPRSIKKQRRVSF